MSTILFRNGPIFDGVTPEPREGLEVLVEDGRIKEVSDTAISANGADVVDLAGRTLMPGLIDAHFHATLSEVNVKALEATPPSLNAQHARVLLEGCLNRGFTTIRDAAGADYGHAAAVDTGLIKGPRIFFAGKALSQTGGHGDLRHREEQAPVCACGIGASNFTVIADGVDAVRQAAREELRRGANQIKIMASGGVASPLDPVWNLQYSEEEIRAVVWEAESWKTYVMAHAYTAEAISRCLEFGVRSIEHANLIDEAAAKLAAEKGAFVVPTLIAYDALYEAGERLGLPPVSFAKLDDVREAGRRSLEILRSAGVQVGFGTDLLGGLHPQQNREFLIRAEVLPPAEILLSATSINARLLNRPGELGEIAPGAYADLLVVDGDPLSDIALLAEPDKNLAAIMKDGAWIRQPA